MMSLAVTPLRRIANWPKLILVRRMLGLTALFYALDASDALHIDLKLDIYRVVTEIALRFYLTIGFVALLALIALGSTSTDAAIKRLGRNWNRLHKIVYSIGLLAAFHFFIQSKADVYEPTLMAGFFLLLMFYRLAHWRGFSLTSPLVLVGDRDARRARHGGDRIRLVRHRHRRAARPRARREPAVLLLDQAGMVGVGDRAWRDAARRGAAMARQAGEPARGRRAARAAA